MQSVVFPNKILPYLLVAPQIILTVIFFFWPASQALYQSTMREDAFGLSSEFVGLDNYNTLFAQPEYYQAIGVTALFSTVVGALSLAIALLFATQADKNLKAAPVYKTFLIWPYAVAPAIRYTVLGLQKVDPRTIEAGRAMGCTPRQLLTKIRLKLALPEIMLGLNQTIMFALSMLVITALVGTRDLGQEVYAALAKADIGRGLVAGLAVAFIAIIADRLISAGAARIRRRLA